MAAAASSVTASEVAYASLAASAAATAGTIATSALSADAASKQAAYQAEVARRNSQIESQNAQFAEQAGQSAAEQEGLKARARQANLRATQAALGLDINTGSDVDVAETQRETSVEDRATTEHNAFMKAYGYDVQGAADTAQAGLYSAKAANETALEPLTIGGDLLSGASSLGEKWSKFQQQGAVGASSGGGSGVDSGSWDG